jgi:hypothetical protein
MRQSQKKKEKKGAGDCIDGCRNQIDIHPESPKPSKDIR